MTTKKDRTLLKAIFAAGIAMFYLMTLGYLIREDVAREIAVPVLIVESCLVFYGLGVLAMWGNRR